MNVLRIFPKMYTLSLQRKINMMLKKSILFFLISVFFLLSPKAIFAESIEYFDVDIEVSKDGTIGVTESINYDFGSLDRHGIFRNIPKITENTDGKKYILDIDNISVSNPNGTPYQYKKSTEDNILTLKIGDPDRTITGSHTYVIKYTVKGALTYFSDHDELYWNLTGNDWDILISSASGKIHIPQEVKQENIQATCYTGKDGSTDKNCSINIIGNTVDTNSQNTLFPNEGLTIVVGFPKNIVAVLEPKEYVSFFDTPFGKILLIGIIITVLAIGFFWYIFYPIKIIYKWIRYGRDPKPTLGVTTAWYDAPKTQSGRKLTPAETGALIDETVNMQDIYASIVDLARRGYIKIREEKKGDFYLDKTKKTEKTSDLIPFEKTLINEFFGSKDTLHIKKASLVTEIESVKKEIYENLVEEKFFPENPNSIRTFYSVIGIIGLTTGNIFLFLVAFIFGRSLPRKTILGKDQANVAQSLKNFLSSQERQLEFQAKNQMFFEKLLPFAIAFGVESIWADRFKDIALKPPTWYEGYDNTGFTSRVFVHSLHSSFSSVQKAATPVSSSTGHSSGFSGGSSGGGGGGGGGGSW